MKLLEERIKKDGVVLPGNVLKVNQFLNHQIDPELMYKMGEEFARLFKDEEITKIITVDSSDVYSYTKKVTNTISVDKKFLTSDDKVLVIDDFLANGQAVQGIFNICDAAGAEIKGVGIVIEKSFQEGAKIIHDRGVRLESLAVISSFDDNQVHFEGEE